MIKKILMILIVLSFIATVGADLNLENQFRLSFGHILHIENLSIIDNTDYQNTKTIDITIKNTANFSIYDVRAELGLPSSMSFIEGLSKKKIAKLNSGESVKLRYQIIHSPSIEEGLYEIEVITDYTNHVGSERQENDSFGLIIKKDPNFFIEISETDIYEDNKIGEITITFYNNDLGDIKFFTVELKDSESYKILSKNREYIGDLDSDDFESAEFRIKLKKTSKNLKIPLKLQYRDSFNKLYEEDAYAELKILSAKEKGIEKSNTLWIILILILLILGYIFYKKFYKKKKKI